MFELPALAAWRHRDAREGFEAVFPRREGSGYQLDGYSTAVQEGEAWGIRYSLVLDEAWGTRSAHVVGQSAGGGHEVLLEGARASWLVDGAPAPELAGCLDVDLEASACTNALPVLRLGLDVGESAAAPAVYVRAPELGVQRLEQSYQRLEDTADGHRRFEYMAPAFDFIAVLSFDRFGLVVEYPGIADRVA